MGNHRSLIETAGELADGSGVDWADRESSAQDEHERRLLRQLRIVAGIQDLVRSTPLEESSPTIDGPVAVREQAPGKSPSTPELPGSPPGRWGRLRLVEAIGQGSLGEVYRAHDDRLARDVALKLTRVTESSVAGEALSEARALARVRHPNVVTVIGAEERDGFVGIWMPLVRGQTLDQLVRQQGPLSAREAAMKAQELCRAVAAVHGAGLVHRNITARNVVREHGGRVVLMDAGAGPARRPGEPGAFDGRGTALYTSPEVLEGAPTSIHSDIYSLGVLLFHLVSRRYPVTAHSFEALREAHREGRRVRLHDARPDLPDGFVGVVERALHPDPTRRYATAGAMQTALAASLGLELIETPAEVRAPVLPGKPASDGAAFPHLPAGQIGDAHQAAGEHQTEDRVRSRAPAFVTRPAVVVTSVALLLLAMAVAALLFRRASSNRETAGTGPAPPLLVIRPFETEERNDRYLTLGLTEALARRIAALPGGFAVAGPQDLDTAAPGSRAPAEVLGRLRAQWLLDGRVGRRGDVTRLTLRLHRADRPGATWERAFEQPASELLQLEADAVSGLADGLGLNPPLEAPQARRAVLPEAYDAYLRGRYALHYGQPDDAILLLNEARNRQPDYADAYAALARAYWWKLQFGPGLKRGDMVEAARAAARRALAIDDTVAEAHTLLADIAFEYDRDWEQAEQSYLRALALAPADEAPRYSYAQFLAARQRLDEALEQMSRGRQAHPLSAQMASYDGLVQYYARRHDESIRAFNHALALDSRERSALAGLSLAHRAQGRFDEAEAVVRRALEHKTRAVPSADARSRDREWHALRAELAQALAGQGARSEAEAILREILAVRDGTPDAVRPESVAYVYVALDEPEPAVEWLDRAVAERSGPVLFALVDPRLDPLRSHPRFSELVARLSSGTSNLEP